MYDFTCLFKRFFLPMFLLHCYSNAQSQLNYKLPSERVQSVLNSNGLPLIKVNGDGKWAILLEQKTFVSLSSLSEPELRIAGLRINPTNNTSSRLKLFHTITLLNLSTRKLFKIDGIPKDRLIEYVYWSPNNQNVSFCIFYKNRVELWYTSVKDHQAIRVTNQPLNSVFGTPYEWMSDSKSFMCKVAVSRDTRVDSTASTSPIIMENDGNQKPTRTFQDLLKNKLDERNLELYATSQLQIINLKGKVLKHFSSIGILTTVSSSPDGKYILVKSIRRPFSYSLSWNRFPTNISIYSSQGKLVKVLFDSPSVDQVLPSRDAVSAQPRDFIWRADVSSTICWIEAQDEGNPKIKPEYRDKIFVLNAPFIGKPTLLYACHFRMSAIVWGNDTVAIVQERWSATQQTITWRINPRNPNLTQKLFSYSTTDQYGQPGVFQTNRNQYGRSVLDLTKDGSVYLTGKGATSEGDFPFIDLLSFNTNKPKRVWQSKGIYYEEPSTFLNSDSGKVLVTRESVTEFPNYFLLDIKKGTYVQISNLSHPYPDLKSINTVSLRAFRKDGVELKGEVFLPANYKSEMGPLPTLMWSYPIEYRNKKDASQFVSVNRRFMYLPVLPPLPLILHGYAVMICAMPIVGDSVLYPNDTYLEQLTENASVLVKEASRTGFIDSTRVAISGHSYGAVMVASLLTHSNIFKTGIAMSGAYNRSLTPFGFQSEERSFWQVPSLYDRLSPFRSADKLRYPILLVHGEADNNPGTFPIQSERYYQALVGLGRKVRYVSLPYEGHQYQSKESMFHLFWEINVWLDKHLKDVKSVANE